MPNVLNKYENATLVSVEKVSEDSVDFWKWREGYVGYKGKLYLCVSVDKHPHEHFVRFTDHKDFNLTTSCGKVDISDNHLRITTKNSIYVFEI